MRARGLPHHYDDPVIVGDRLQYQEQLHEFNQLRPIDVAAKDAMPKAMFAEVGESCHIETPAHANWGFWDVYMGQCVYCNVNLTVDAAEAAVVD
jgi:galactoside O-acetyltransferase